MASGDNNRQVFTVKDLTTDTLTLYPSSAQVTQILKNITLKSGVNEIEIVGITPTADSNSFQVEGLGHATIADTTVELVDNPRFFEDVFPDSEKVDENRQRKEDLKHVHHKSLESQLHDINGKITACNDENGAILAQRDFLNKYCSSLNSEHVTPTTAQESVNMFEKNRAALDIRARTNAGRKRTLVEEQQRLLHKIRPYEKKLEIKWNEYLRREAHRKKAEEQAGQDRERFWPKKVYRLVITLETNEDALSFTEIDSMDAVSTEKETGKDPEKVGFPQPQQPENEPEDGLKSSLQITYITKAAKWTPRYDIFFSSENKTAKIVYKAELHNETSETWKDAQICLSTSQAAFSGVQDKLPWLDYWKLYLTKYGGNRDIARSFQEVQAANAQTQQTQSTDGQRDELFGRDKDVPKEEEEDEDMGFGLFEENYDPTIEDSYNGNVSSAAPVARAKKARRGVSIMPRMASLSMSAAPKPAPPPPGSFDSSVGYLKDAAMLGGGGPTLAEHTATASDQGMTMTYELSGRRTLAPSKTPRRFRITTLLAKQIQLKTLTVPKLRKAAFLEATFSNPSSSVSLLGAPAGLTLDGTFLGTTALPYTAPGAQRTVGLGIDPAVEVSYVPPTCRRSTQGAKFLPGSLGKADAQLFERCIVVRNTKNAPLKLTVFDQVPVSEDEKLKVELVSPAGLREAGEPIRGVGQNGKEGKKEDRSWGSATCELLKDGMLRWEVSLEKGASCSLSLEYEVRKPVGENVDSRTQPRLREDT